ncbi:MAG: hypothetical protein VXZ15_05210, partial [Planctomycetota bacterium]|nr:hypothetical protein [Planctomycetota bacterium]
HALSPFVWRKAIRSREENWTTHVRAITNDILKTVPRIKRLKPTTAWDNGQTRAEFASRQVIAEYRKQAA